MNTPATLAPAPGRPGAAARLAELRATVRATVRRPSRTALVTDVLLYALFSFPVLIGVLSQPLGRGPVPWAEIAGLTVLAAAVAVCRAWPTAALLAAMCLTGLHGNYAFAMPVLAYLTGLRTARAQPPLLGFAAVLAGGAALSVARGVNVTAWFPATVWLVLLGVLPWLVGRYWRQYQELLRAGWERAERLEHQQRIIAERERLRERARIAQDMHDSLGHELALIAVRAGALQVAPGLADRHRAAAAELRAGAAEATDHLREIIGVLRDDTGPAAPGTAPGGEPAAAPVRPARESIPDLVERARASGVPIELTIDAPDPGGVPDGPPDARTPPPEPPPMVALAAHRVVQEAVTNAAKHAPGAAVTVRLTHRGPGDPITVTVANQPPPGEPPLLPSGGHGLTGLTERVRLLGGTLHAAPTPDGGFQVTADIPATPTTPAPDTGTGPDAGEWTSESARHLATRRRQVRRGLITAIAVPAALMTVLGGIMVGYYAYTTLNSVLEPADYAALRVGDPEDRVTDTLPPLETPDADVVRQTVPEPAHARCRYYRPDPGLIGTGRVYRLCFADGRLTAKNSYDTAQLSAGRTDDPAHRKDGP
ncbi:sensor histidine kinase [Actinomadura chibensis]|uniref:histidine kinase n=1 Tax=Actinomadura chibensis TaxID=392828 RepID=A0A5D0NA81_9ACTN|nr:sensor histidine kinase [Actinomadura chibensis]TYB41333.1 sensor histidine kinase [Actinomadura chibensis]